MSTAVSQGQKVPDTIQSPDLRWQNGIIISFFPLSAYAGRDMNIEFSLSQFKELWFCPCTGNYLNHRKSHHCKHPYSMNDLKNKNYKTEEVK